MTMPDPMHSSPEHKPTPRISAVGWLLVAGGALAWIVALIAVLAIMPGRDADQSNPATDLPDRVGLIPTLGAVTATPTQTATPTATATATPLPGATVTSLPTATPTRIPILTATPSAVPPVEDSSAPASEAPDVPDTVEPSAVPASDTPADVPAEIAPEAEADTVTFEGGCSVPAGWERYVVQDGDTLFAFVLGAGPEAGLTVDDLIAANCLTSRYLLVDQVLYLPPGAAENAPPSEPYVAPGALGVRGPRTPNCPCVIAVPVGWRREQVAQAVQNAQTSFTGADFLAATDPGVSAPFDFVQERPAGQSMEGFLFPGTYTVQNETTAEQFRDMLLEAFAANVSPQMRADAAAQGVTFYQALIIASIVQRETRAAETQPLVASVYHNRFRAGGRLGSTVTVQYAVGRSGAWWPRLSSSDLQAQSPFNTYNRPGLPPAPIDSPGLSAITAAVYPAQTDYYYHGAACGGGVAFAATYEEHLANINCD